MKKIYHQNKAFTLIELLVVIAIISFLSALVLNSLASARVKANEVKISEDLRQVKIAAELYYNDNHEYPPGYNPLVIKDTDNHTTTINNKGWINKLSFFVKMAEAGTTHNTLLCKNFDYIAGDLVSKKYMASVPVHPYDNDTKGICYKALNNNQKTFVSYALLASQVGISSGSSISKRTGFIIGDTSEGAIAEVNTVISGTLKISGSPEKERGYPAGSDGETAPSATSPSIDMILGVTSGAKSTSGTISTVIDKVTTTNATPTPEIPSLIAAGGYCSGSNSECATGYCGYQLDNSPQGYSRICVTGDAGQLCNGGDSCKSGVCGVHAVCVNHDNETCSIDMDCQSGSCVNNVCVTPEPLNRWIGATCNNNGDCDSGICGYQLDYSAPQGYARVCGTGDTGQLCESNNQCTTNICGMHSLCAKPDGNGCNYDYECQSDICSAGSCTSQTKSVGEYCNYDYQCQSNFCPQDGSYACAER